VCKFLGSGAVSGREKIYNSFVEIPTDIEDPRKKEIKNYPIK
jgi:hypothetical protein